MLYLYQSNRLENLARVFTGLQKLMPPENPLAAEEIVVQSQGMRRFPNLHLAKRIGRGGQFEIQPARRPHLAADARMPARPARAEPVCARSDALAAAGFVSKPSVSDGL